MPVVRIDYDNEKLVEKEAVALAGASRKIVSKATGIEDVFVYAQSAHIKVNIAPVEIFVEMSAHKITDQDALTQKIKSGLAKWKKETNFAHPINLTLIPMQWKIEIGI